MVRNSNGKITRIVRKQLLVVEVLASQLRRMKKKKSLTTKQMIVQIICNKYMRKYRILNECKGIASLKDMKSSQESDQVIVKKRQVLSLRKIEEKCVVQFLKQDYNS